MRNGFRPQNSPDFFMRAKWDAGMLSVHFTPDVILPASYYTKRGTARGDSERRLLIDLLESALQDLSYVHIRGSSGGNILTRNAVESAWAWLMDDDPRDGAGYAITTCCDQLGLDLQAVRHVAYAIRYEGRRFTKTRSAQSRCRAGLRTIGVRE